MSKFLANERRRYIYKVFSHWSRTCSPTVRKRIQFCVTLVSLRISSMALTLQFVVRFSLVSQCQIYSFFVYRQFVLLSLLVTNKLALKVSISHESKWYTTHRTLSLWICFTTCILSSKRWFTNFLEVTDFLNMPKSSRHVSGQMSDSGNLDCVSSCRYQVLSTTVGTGSNIAS